MVQGPGQDSFTNKPIRRMFAQRFALAKTRVVRVKVLAKAVGKKVGGLFVSGISLSILHSVPIFGISGADLGKSRSLAVETVGLTAGQSSYSLMLTMGIGYDPLFHATIDPVKTYVTSLWDKRNRLGHIANTFSLISPRLEACSKPWFLVKGPIAAAYLSLKRIGWSLVSAFNAFDHQGFGFSLFQVSPTNASGQGQARRRSILIFAGLQGVLH